MLNIPVAFVLFTALILVACSLWRRRHDNRAIRPFLVLVLLSALQAMLVGLRWDFGLAQLRIGQVLVASALPPTAWLVFQTAVSGRRLPDKAVLRHVLIPALVALALSFAPDAIDILLVLNFLIYGFLFLRLARGSEVQFAGTAFEGMFNMRLAIWLLAFTLIGSALIDVFVFIDYLSLGGIHATRLIGIGNMIWLLALGVSVALGSQVLGEQSESDPIAEPAAPLDEDIQNATKIEQLLRQSNLIRDPDLNLSRLARRAGLPVKTVSNAINRVHGCNVSQYINAIRIENACDLISGTQTSITEAIYASGFHTKSNFNREFLRVKGRTPSDWRKGLGKSG